MTHPSIYLVATECPRSLDPIYIVTYFIKWVKTSWTDSVIHDLFEMIKVYSNRGI